MSQEIGFPVEALRGRPTQPRPQPCCARLFVEGRWWPRGLRRLMLRQTHFGFGCLAAFIGVLMLAVTLMIDSPAAESTWIGMVLWLAIAGLGMSMVLSAIITAQRWRRHGVLVPAEVTSIQRSGWHPAQLEVLAHVHGVIHAGGCAAPRRQARHLRAGGWVHVGVLAGRRGLRCHYDQTLAERALVAAAAAKTPARQSCPANYPPAPIAPIPWPAELRFRLSDDEAWEACAMFTHGPRGPGPASGEMGQRWYIGLALLMVPVAGAALLFGARPAQPFLSLPPAQSHWPAVLAWGCTLLGLVLIIWGLLDRLRYGGSPERVVRLDDVGVQWEQYGIRQQAPWASFTNVAQTARFLVLWNRQDPALRVLIPRRALPSPTGHCAQRIEPLLSRDQT